MIPSGICLDLETTITLKIPDHIRSPGYKRYETRIIEIGAVLWQTPEIRYQALVNPICTSASIGTSKELFQHLSSIHQHPTRTLNFWSKVLVKRRSLTRAMLGESPEVWLARQVDSRAKTFVRWHNRPETGPAFVTEKEGLLGLLAFTKKHQANTWLAHNGHSFDYKVLDGCGERCAVLTDAKIQKLDTLKLFRKQLPGHKSYSQPILYEKLFRQKYNAHVAIDDAIALSKLCKHCNAMTAKILKSGTTLNKKPAAKDAAKRTTGKTTATLNTKKMHLTFGKAKPRPAKPRPAKPRGATAARKTTKRTAHVQKLRGVGPKTAAALSVFGIRTIQELQAQYHESGAEWLQSILPYGVRWKVVAESLSNC